MNARARGWVCLHISIVAADEKQHIRLGLGRPFRGLIGVVIGVGDAGKFRDEYNKILDDFFKLFDQKRRRKVYKSYEIGGFFPGNRQKIMAAYRYLANRILRIRDVEINVYYLTLNMKELRERAAENEPEKPKEPEEAPGPEPEKIEPQLITIYGEKGRDAAAKVSVTDFFAKVREYFPIVCAWKLCSYLEAWDPDVVLDGCKGEISHAWEELVSGCSKVSIAFGGDLYNPFVSTADLLVKWIDEDLRESGMPLNQSALDRLLRQWKGVTDGLDTKHIHVVHISNKDLKDIQPLSKERIDAFERVYARHPIFFIFREEMTEKERKEIENSPRMDRILDLICENDGSLLWWDPHVYSSVIAEGDVAIVFGPRSEKEAKFLLEEGDYPIKILKAKNI